MAFRTSTTDLEFDIGLGAVTTRDTSAETDCPTSEPHNGLNQDSNCNGEDLNTSEMLWTAGSLDSALSFMDYSLIDASTDASMLDVLEVTNYSIMDMSIEKIDIQEDENKPLVRLLARKNDISLEISLKPEIEIELCAKKRTKNEA